MSDMVVSKDFSVGSIDACVELRDLGLRHYTDAIVVSPAKDKKMPSSLHGFFGGVYTNNHEFVAFSMQTRVGAIRTVYEQERVDFSNVKHVAGSALYAGALYPHYGHFLLESTSRLWPLKHDNQFDHIVFQVPPGASASLNEFQSTFLRSQRLSQNIMLVCDQDASVRFDEVTIPEPAFEIEKRLNREFGATFARIETANKGLVSLYLSRLNMQHGIVVGEEQLQRLFVHLGFEVYHPEQHSLEEQMRKYATVGRIAGMLGSALHNVLFMPREVEVFNIIRSEKAPLRSFYLTDNVMNANAHYIDGIDFRHLGTHPDRGPPGPFVIDMNKVIHALKKIGSVNLALLASFAVEGSEPGPVYRGEWHYAEAMSAIGRSDLRTAADELSKSLTEYRSVKACELSASVKDKLSRGTV